MGFGSDLRNSQEAVLKLQDWELRFLETVKKFMALRIKSDKEYACNLQNLCNQVDKESTVQVNYVSNVSKDLYSGITKGGLKYCPHALSQKQAAPGHRIPKLMFLKDLVIFDGDQVRDHLEQGTKI